MQQNIDIDNELRKCAFKAQKYQAGSYERRIALARLLSTIEHSNLLARPRIPHHLHGSYSEIYAESKQRLFCYICEKIDNYNPKYKVLQWVNFLLRKRFIVEATRELIPEHQEIFPDDLEYQETPVTDDHKILLDYIIQDPDRIFQNTHIIGNSKANFQFIALKVLEGYSWKEISKELGIPIPTLASFYQRKFKKFRASLQEYLQAKREENISAASFNS